MLYLIPYPNIWGRSQSYVSDSYWLILLNWLLLCDLLWSAFIFSRWRIVHCSYSAGTFALGFVRTICASDWIAVAWFWGMTGDMPTLIVYQIQQSLTCLTCFINSIIQGLLYQTYYNYSSINQSTAHVLKSTPPTNTTLIPTLLHFCHTAQPVHQHHQNKSPAQ